MFALITN